MEAGEARSYKWGKKVEMLCLAFALDHPTLSAEAIVELPGYPAKVPAITLRRWMMRLDQYHELPTETAEAIGKAGRPQSNVLSPAARGSEGYLPRTS
jgi:hypothetical protein